MLQIVTWDLGSSGSLTLLWGVYVVWNNWEKKEGQWAQERKIEEILPFRDLKPFIIGDSRNSGGHRLKANG